MVLFFYLFVERAVSITPTSTLTATLFPTTSSFRSITSLETSGTGTTDNSMTDVLVSDIKATTSTDFATSEAQCANIDA